MLQLKQRGGDQLAGALQSGDRLLLALAGQNEHVAGFGAIEMIEPTPSRG